MNPQMTSREQHPLNAEMHVGEFTMSTLNIKLAYIKTIQI